jgi:putative chitinase
MTIDRKPIFDAFRTFMGGSLSQPDVEAMNEFLDRMGKKAVAVKHALADPVAFFAGVRGVTGSLDQVQVDTINRLLETAAYWPTGWMAYGLATAWHECRLRPIDEIGKGRGREYGKAGARKEPIPNRPLYGGQIPYGRGLVQLTWCDNYEWADKALGLGGDLLKNFDLALEPKIAADILVKGMEEGAFTGKALKDYLPERLGRWGQFVLARKIVNGNDKAQHIANLATSFQDALEAGGWQ